MFGYKNINHVWSARPQESNDQRDYGLCDTFNHCWGVATRAEFLLRVLPDMELLFRVCTPYSSVSLRIASRSCDGEMKNMAAYVCSE